ncbi:putative membrane protein (TIGR02226 family) [Algoriphagus boseongensis]|uniref:Putative membrane protein (TIGR02226 family) n=1 Tax=Algoriphagus boseongensis TaxID=1442587 RepID=A0A4R6TB06_9BACT|nr:BatA domain-containing protein [Algoriphagus boseongensis]TDQ18835.1 putative membrane protein (TIGR02226 family) [Algoriphagus boseongensis]
MEWVQANFLWALAGLAVPVAIHLWNGKRGKVIAWAATAWLNPKESQSSKSLKLEEKVLLLTRLLLWTTLVFLVVGILIKGLSKNSEPRVLHLAIPNAAIESEFRFELTQALEKGESVLWLAEGLPEYEEGVLPEEKFEGNNLQSFFDEVPNDWDSIHIYTLGAGKEFQKNAYWLPQRPILHLSESDLLENKLFVDLGSDQFLGLDSQGILQRFEEKGIEKLIDLTQGIPVFIELSEENKSQVLSALSAITEVYGLNFSETDSLKAQVVFSENKPLQPKEDQLLFLVDSEQKPDSKNEINLGSPVSLTWAEVIEKGILPELILDPVLSFIEFEPDRKLSSAELEKKFNQILTSKLAKKANTNEYLLVFIVLLFCFERYLAFRKNL